MGQLEKLEKELKTHQQLGAFDKFKQLLSKGLITDASLESFKGFYWKYCNVNRFENDMIATVGY